MLRRQSDAGAGESSVCQVRQDAETNGESCQRLDVWGQALGDRVHHVGPHRVDTVEHEVEDHHGLGREARLVVVQHANVKIAHPAPALDEARVNRSCHCMEPWQCLLDGGCDRLWMAIGHRDVHLADHLGRVAVCAEAASGPCETSHVGHGCHDRRLFHDHRHDALSPVDEEVQSHCIG
jgi:hypothetical protein